MNAARHGHFDMASACSYFSATWVNPRDPPCPVVYCGHGFQCVIWAWDRANWREETLISIEFPVLCSHIPIWSENGTGPWELRATLPFEIWPIAFTVFHSDPVKETEIPITRDASEEEEKPLCQSHILRYYAAAGRTSRNVRSSEFRAVSFSNCQLASVQWETKARDWTTRYFHISGTIFILFVLTTPSVPLPPPVAARPLIDPKH